MSGLDDFIGQTAIKALLRPKIQAAKNTGTSVPHLLLCGRKEQGKSSLAAALAAEMGVAFSCVSAEAMEKTLDLTGPLTSVCERGIFTVSEVESLRPALADILVDVISALHFDIAIGVGPGARTHTIAMPRFTFVGTSSKPWLVDERIRRWCIPCEFAGYSEVEAAEIVMAIAKKKGIQLDADAAYEVASRCKGKPGDAEVFLQKAINHFSFTGSEQVGRSTIVWLSDFLGLGYVYPDEVMLTDQLRQMTGIEFEHWVADLFRRSGFQVETTQASGDHGVDLRVSRDHRLVVVQCKRWDSAVGEPILRDLYGAMMAANANSGCLVTTGSFTAQAQRFAEGKPLCLMGWDTLMEVVRSREKLEQLLR